LRRFAALNEGGKAFLLFATDRTTLMLANRFHGLQHRLDPHSHRGESASRSAITAVQFCHSNIATTLLELQLIHLSSALMTCTRRFSPANGFSEFFSCFCP